MPHKSFVDSMKRATETTGSSGKRHTTNGYGSNAKLDVRATLFSSQQYAKDAEQSAFSHQLSLQWAHEGAPIDRSKESSFFCTSSMG